MVLWIAKVSSRGFLRRSGPFCRMDRRRKDNEEVPTNYFTTLVNSLREFSDKHRAICLCEETRFAQKSPAKAIAAGDLRGWKCHKLAADERHSVHSRLESRCASHVCKDDSTTKSRGAVRRFGARKRNDEKAVFRHYETPSDHAEVYRRHFSSVYRNSRAGEGAIFQHSHAPSGCCSHWYDTAPPGGVVKAMGSSGGVCLENTQQHNWSKLDDLTNERNRMSFHVEWKFKSSPYHPDPYRAVHIPSDACQQHRRQLDHQHKVTSQLLQLMKVSHYASTDPKSDPLTGISYVHSTGKCLPGGGREGVAVDPTSAAGVGVVPESFCNPLACSHGCLVPVARPKLSSLTPRNMPAPEPMVNPPPAVVATSGSVLAKVAAARSGRERPIVSMQPVPVSGWRKRPPLLERRMSASAYSSSRMKGGGGGGGVSGRVGFASGRPQTMTTTSYSIHNIQLNNAAMFKLHHPVPRNVGIPSCVTPHSSSSSGGKATAGSRGHLFRLSLRSTS